MKIEMELWHLISLMIVIIGAFWALGKIILIQAKGQIDQQLLALGTQMGVQEQQAKDQLKTLSEYMQAQSEQAKQQIDKQFAALGEHMKIQDENGRRLERQLMELKAELPRDYVRREDYTQAIATIMTKIDHLGLRVENYFRELMVKGRE